MEDDAFAPVPQDQRHSWWKTSFVWAGSSICVPVIMIGALMTGEPVEPMSLVEDIALVIGAQAVGSTIAPDYHRFCCNRKESCMAVLVGIPPNLLFLMIAGAIMGAGTGETDITMVIANLGLPIIGLIVLILATWTTMATDAYTGGLAITSLLHLSGTHRAAATAIAGVCGILLAVFGIMDYFADFLNVMAACIPPVAGVMIADYWVIKRGRRELWHESKGVNRLAVIALILGVVCALTIPVGISTINGVLVSLLSYLLLMFLFRRDGFDIAKNTPKTEEDRSAEGMQTA
jgi:cytosine permease